MPKKSTHLTQMALEERAAPDVIRILIAWSPSSTGTEAIQYAAWLAKTAQVQVRVISTITQPWTTTSLTKLGGKYKKWFKKEAEACAKAVKAELSAAGLDKASWDGDVSLLIDGASKANVLTVAAQEFNADVILLGSSAASPKGRFLAGTTADALMHSSPIPLGLAPRSAKLSKHGITRVNFAFVEEPSADMDPSKVLALRLAAIKAKTWNVPLRIVAFSASGLMNTPTGNLDVSKELTSHWRETSLALLDVASDFVLDEFPDLTVEADVGSGNGWAGAVDALKWKKGDLLCLGSTPLSPFERVFLGSTTSELLPHLRVPVVIYPAVPAE